MSDMTPITRAEKNDRLRKHRIKVSKYATQAALAGTVEGWLAASDKLSKSDLRRAVAELAGKLGLVDTVKQLYALIPAPERQNPDVPKAIPGDLEGDQPKSLALPRKTFESTPESRLATVYGKPIHPRQRLIEFKDDGSHGVLWLPYDHPCWVGWTIWAKKNPNAQQQGYILDGSYSWRGIRLK